MEKNIISYIAGVFAVVVLCIYVMLGAIVDFFCKIGCGIICILCSIPFILFFPFFIRVFGKRHYMKYFGKFYTYGGRWAFKRENYVVTNFFLNTLNYE